MILDNKTRPQERTDIKTVWDYISRYTKGGTLNIVTGYFTISALGLLKKFEKEPKMFRLILGEIADTQELQDHIVDILSGDTSINNAFSINQFAKAAIEFLQQENVDIKRIDTNFCHAKAYIYEDTDDYDNSFFVMGSSNFTESGLGIRPGANIEMNIAAKGSDSTNYTNLLTWFNETWNKVALDKIEVTEDEHKVRKQVKQYFIDCIQNLYKEYQPADIYYKILFELFSADIEASFHDSANKQIVRLEDSVVWDTLFGYQRKGVRSLINMLNKYDGAILADAVGLGKTFSALAVMKYFQNEGYVTVVLCPKKLEQNWLQYRYKTGSRFENDQFDYEVRFHTDLQDDRLERSYDQAKLSWLVTRPKLLLVIDESHNLRNDKSGRYNYLLEQILNARKNTDIKVLELSATPINTNINDVRNQFKLFVRGRDDGFAGDDFEIPSLIDLFRVAQREVQRWSERENRTIAELVNALPDKFLNLTDKLVVARTRKMIEKSEGKALGFPSKNKPTNEYLGITEIGDLHTFDEIYEALLASNLTAYRPSFYTTEQPTMQSFGEQTVRENFLVKMMLTLFLKRLESSWFACKSTVEKVLEQHEHALEKVNAFIAGRDRNATIDDYEDVTLDEDDENGGLTLGKKNPIALADIVRMDDFKRDLEADIEVLRNFTVNMQKYADAIAAGTVKDEKVERLKEILADKVNRSRKKVLIFTSYADTADYLYKVLNEAFPGRVACVNGSGATFIGNKEKNFQDTLMRFAPQSKMYKEYDWSRVYHAHFPTDSPKFDRQRGGKWTVKYDEWKKVIAESTDPLARRCHALLNEPVSILIATDCLSEGQNLQDAQTVVNYDIHWNPVRIIQRVGRIDRIGSPNTAIDCYNFWPAESYEGYLDLAGRIERRMATMALMGTETLAVTDELERQLRENPILDKNDRKLLDQIQDTIDDVDAGEQTFGLHDLSLENFRQDLLEFLGDKGDQLRTMPNGIYSGFKTVDTLFDEVPESIVALVASPHKPTGARNHQYTDFYLVLRPVNAERQEHVKVFNRQEILSILRLNLNKRRNVPAAIDRGDATAIRRLTDIMQGWAKEQVPQQAGAMIADLFGGNLQAAAKTKGAAKLEEKFNLDNLDLICWEYITK